MSLISSVKFSEDIPTYVHKLLERATDCIKKDQWELALSLSTIVFEESENVLGSDSHDVGLFLSYVGFFNALVDKYDEAESAWRKAVLILEKDNKESHYVITILRNLVELLIENERYDEAEFFGRKAIRIYKKLHEIDEFELAKLRVTIGEVLLQLKKPNEAKKCFVRALPVYAEKFGIDTAQMKKIFRSLEIVYFWRDNIIESKKRLDSANNCEDAFSLFNLGISCENKFPYKAVDYYQHAVKIEESQSCPNNWNLSALRLRLGKCYLKIDDCREARSNLEKSRAFHKKTVTDDIPEMLDINIHLALCYVKSAKWNDARKICEEILGNVYTDESDVPILKVAENYEKSEKNKAPILFGKSDIIHFALKNLSALYFLDGKYGAAKILQDFGESEYDLIEDYEI